MEPNQLKFVAAERKCRTILAYFSSFIFLFCLFHSVFVIVKRQPLHILYIPVFIAMLISCSLLLTRIAIKEFQKFGEEFEWEQKKHLAEYRTFVHIVQTIGVLVFYFYIQIGFTAVFFPSMVTISLHRVPFYVPFYCANCFLIYLFYARYIFPFQKQSS